MIDSADNQYEAMDSSHVFQPRPPGAAPPPGSRPNQRRSLRIGLIVLAVLIIAFYIHRTSNMYYVQYIVDGDTFAINYHGQIRMVQLAGADAPERHKGEAYASEAYDYLAERVEHKKVFLEFLDPSERLDYKDRMLCWVWIEGNNLSYELVARGLAKFSGAAEGDTRRILTMLQDDARNQGRGLWSAKTASYQPEE